MQKGNTEFVIAQATDKRQTSPFSKAVRGAIEVGVVVPSILRTNLEDAEFTVKEDEASMGEYGFKSSKFLKRVLITDDTGTIIAMGASADHEDALLHAVLGWYRENAVGDPGEVPAGLGTVEALAG